MADATPSPSAFRRILALARPELGTLTWATLALLGTSGLTLAYPQLVRLVVDGVTEGDGVASVDRYALILLGLFTLAGLLGAARSYLFTVAGERIVARLRQRLFSRLMAQEVAFFDTHRTGELTNRLAADCTVVQNAATVNVSMLLRYAFTSVGALVILAVTSWQLTLVMLALVPVAVLGGVFYGRLVRKLSRKAQDALARATEVAEETLSGIRTVRAFSQERAESARYADKVEDAFGVARERARFAAAFGAIAQFAGQGAIAGVLWYGAHLLDQGTLSVGELTQFLLYTFTVAFGIGALGGLYQDFMRAIGASERVFEFIERAPAQPPGGQTLPRVRGEVRFDGVRFRYPSRPDHPVLAQVDLAVQPGQVMALVGPSGGGKSTLAALLSRFYDPDAGAVRLDGVDLRALDPDWLRRQIGVVAQEPVLFATTVGDNVRYGRPDATDAEVRAALEAANALGFVEAMPEGLDTPVGERGVQLSGGQKQRVAIARALLADPPLLVLDEATSALDAESEHLVQKALERLMRGRTTLLIAHRLSTVQAADTIAVIDQGRVAEAGRHAELLAQGGLYRQLVARQRFD